MTDTIRATPTDTRVTHDLELTDGVTNLGLILCNSKGIPIQGGNPWTLRQSGSTRTSLQISSGDADYSTYQLPYTPFTQKDWSGGRGNEDFEDDKTRYYDSSAMDTRMGDIILAGKPTTVDLFADAADIEPITSTGGILIADTSSHRFASSFLADDTASFDVVWVMAAAGEDVTVEVILDDSGAPSADSGDLIASGTITIPALAATTASYGACLGGAPIGCQELGHGVDVPSAALRVELVEVTMIGSYTSGYTYWVVVTSSAVGYGAKTSASVLEEDGTWGSAYSDSSLYFLIDARIKGIIRFFEYKGQLYAAATQDNGLQSALFMNGYRFTAENSSTQTVIQTPLTLTANELVGCTLQVIAGKCYTEHPNYRTIVSNTTDAITVDRGFLNTPDNTTDIVILGRDLWTEITGTGLQNGITSILIAEETVFFAQGEDFVIRKMVESNTGGIWGRAFSDEGSTKASFIAQYPNHEGKQRIWIFNNPSSGSPFASYARPDEEKLKNPGFELLGAGVDEDDVFLDWEEHKGNGTILEEYGAGNILAVDGGVKAAKLTTGADVTCYIFQRFKAVAGHTYTLTFWIKGDGTNKASYKVYNETGKADIVASTDVGTASTAFFQVTKEFTAPTSCEIIGIYLYGKNTDGAIAYFDDVSVVDKALDFISKPRELETDEGDPEYDYPIIIGDARSKITGVVGYGDPILPHVFKEDEFGSINNGIYAKYPISELAQVKNILNGSVAIQFGVYLFFNVLDGWERFYQNKIDDVGPNRDEGIPEGRRGSVSAVVSYPGGMYLGINAGYDGYSSVMYWNQIGYHELFRAPFGSEIRSLAIQTFPGNPVGRLWIGTGSETVWKPITLNPRKQENYRYTDTGTLISSWFNGGFREINKFWKSIQLYGENLSAGQTVSIEYQTDVDETWYALPETFTAAPMQEVLMDTDYSVSGKRWRYRVTMTTDDDTQSPRIKALTVPSVTRLPNQKAWSITVLADDALVDRQGQQQALTAKELMDQLQLWAESADTPVPLTLRSPVSAFDNKRVFIEPPTVQPIEVVNHRVKKLKAICTLVMYEA